MPRTGTNTGLVKMNKDATSGAIILKDIKKPEQFNPKVTHELIHDKESGEYIERPKIEFPDLEPISDVEGKEVAVAQGYNSKQVTQFIQKFVQDRKQKGDPYAERNAADFSPPNLAISGNDGLHIWLELFKYGRQTVDRICRHVGAYDPLYTQSLITLLINTGYLFKYEDGTVDCIPDTVREKLGFIPPRKEEPEEKEIEIDEESLPENMRVVRIVEEEPPKKKFKLKSKTRKEEELEIPDVDAD